VAHKKKHVPPVPPANRSPSGPPETTGDTQLDKQTQLDTDNEGGFQEQDPKRRLGNYTGAGEQSYKQPGGLNDANH